MQRQYRWVLFSLLLLVPSSCVGQEPLKKILSGYIREEGSGHIVSEARIELQNAMGTPISFAYSDRNGAFEFDDIGGDCYVSVQHEGYAPLREFVRPDGSGHVYRDIFLRIAGHEAGSKSASPVSEHELGIPPKAREFFEKGVQLVVEKSDYRGAVAQFERAIAKYPSYYEAYAAMGMAQNRIGDAAAAEAALRKSVELSAEKYPQALINLGSMYNGQKRFADAEPLFRKAIALDASSWHGQYELALALSGQQRYKDALASAIASRDLKQDNPQIYLLLYNLHVRTEDFPGALHDTERYLKLSPDGAAAERVRKMQEQVQKEFPVPKESYCFRNTTELLVTGVLNVKPISGETVNPEPLTLAIPGKGTVCKSVGPGKDINIPISSVASASFVHDGPAGAVEADAFQLDASTLEVKATSHAPVSPNR